VEQIFLQVKWAHKLDAPATLGCIPSQPEFSATHVSIKAECKEKGKTFVLQIPLFGSISPENCTWANAAVGRATITLQKTQHGPWARLLMSPQRPANQGIWFAMRENHQDRLENWTPSPKSTPPQESSPPPPTPESPTVAPSETPVPLPNLASLGGLHKEFAELKK